MRKDAPGSGRGFTLLQLSLTMAIATVLLGLALPGFQNLLRQQRTAAALHLLSTELALARNTAISRGTPVTLCPSLGDGRCRAEPDWSMGWLVYRDPQRMPQPRALTDILQDIRRPLHPSVVIQSTAGRLRVRYQPEGFSPGSNLTLRICTAGRLRGEVVVNNAGRPRTRRLPGTEACPS
jgi:type IV fimbrial biogenesis protein FimT